MVFWVQDIQQMSFLSPKQNSKLWKQKLSHSEHFVSSQNTLKQSEEPKEKIIYFGINKTSMPQPETSPAGNYSGYKSQM